MKQQKSLLDINSLAGVLHKILIYDIIVTGCAAIFMWKY